MSHTARSARLGVLVVGLALLVSMWSPLRAEAATFKTPTGLKAVPEKTTSTSFHLDWNPVSGASGYRVKYATNSSMTGATNLSVRYSSANLRNLQPNTRYWFRVAVASNLGTGTTQSGYTPAPSANLRLVSASWRAITSGDGPGWSAGSCPRSSLATLALRADQGSCTVEESPRITLRLNDATSRS